MKDLKPRCIMMVAGEASGDLHGSALAVALFKKDPSLQIMGIGGSAMKQAGVDIRFDSALLGIVGIVEVIGRMRVLWKAYQIARAAILTKADLLVLIDFPDFNLLLAKIARKKGIPVIYYIGPQLWAWRKDRITIMAQRVDKALVIFPFEKKVYEDAAIPCEFVGHPLLDEATPFLETAFSKPEYLQSKGLSPLSVTIGLLPGSRVSEIKRHLPVMLDGVKRLAADRPPFQILIPVASTISIDLIRKMTRAFPLPIRPVTGEIYSVLRACDAVVIASGTATLQAALTQTPMVMIYKLSAISYLIARLFLRIRLVGLVNIVAQADLVPELIQGQATPDCIAAEMKRLLTDTVLMQKMRTHLKTVAQALGQAGASDRAADIIYNDFIREAVP